MATEVIWRPHLAVSNLHIARAASDQAPLIDQSLAQAIDPAVREFVSAIHSAGLPAERFWSHLIPLAAKSGGRRQLIETAVTKTSGRGVRFAEIISSLTASLAALEAAVQSALPNLASELSHREGPLREQWEAHGPGMLAEIARLVSPEILPQQCEVLLVYPALGGGGEAHLAYNSVRIEAVLANPIAELPETVRLAWLIAQLQLDLPVQSDSIPAHRLPQIARLAMLPPALAAAETVELARFSTELLAQAITAWRLPLPATADAPALLSQWWETYLQTRPDWNIALAALDQLFQ